MNGNPILQNNVDFRRIIFFAAVVGIVFIVYLFRLFSLQILQGSQWNALAEENRISEINVPSQRGIIMDRNDFILARNIAAYNVVITPAELPDDIGEIQEIYRSLSELADIPINLNEVTPENPFVPCLSDHGITQIVEYGTTSAPYTPVRIKCDIDQTSAMVIKERAIDWPGVEIEIESVRDYPTGSLTASLTGFLGPISALEEDYFVDRGFVPNRDKVGYAGVERYFQSFLAGRNGKRVVEVDVAGQILRDLAPPIPSSPGFNIRMTLDTRLQSAAVSILENEINFWNTYLGTIRSTSGVVIAMNPQPGDGLLPVVREQPYGTYHPSILLPTT
jgi:penicillin-binding protein 2